MRTPFNDYHRLANCLTTRSLPAGLHGSVVVDAYDERITLGYFISVVTLVSDQISEVDHML